MALETISDGRGTTVTPPRTPVVPRRRRRAWGVTAAVSAIAAVLNLPLFFALLTSFKSDADIARSALRVPDTLTLEHYANAMGQAGYDFPRYFLNSTLISIGTVVTILVICVPGAYAMGRLGLGRGHLLKGIAALRLIPVIFFAVPFFLLFSRTGLYDTIPGMVTANTFISLPLGTLLVMSAIREVPHEIEEAAKLDGCSDYRIVARIVLPLLAPTLAAVAVLVFITAWSDYLFAVILTSSEATPVTVGAANFVTSTGIRWGDISATTVLSVLPPLVFALFAQRYLVRGLSAGAIKG
ncbi:carbohydrate ABC transporter permease [Phytoactinopolyspora limicola]|uniref:carbohydrate ABC transporter permease n=1 Tax=Phytoactinopolyspora limicola TaxID=2715536 RepID=UPI001407DB93|nr:carbohydrate ABC transporter permease [Phytoactinopolyspora limicola]